MPELLAKPTGITLRDHTAHVVGEAEELLTALPFVQEKYVQRTGLDLTPMVIRAAEVHDKGKAHKTWQNACQKDHAVFRRTGRNEGKHLSRPPYLRHEFASLLWAERQGIDLSLPEQVAVAAHHGKLSYRHEHRWREDDDGRFYKLWKAFHQIRRKDLLSLSEGAFDEALIERYRLGGARSLLQLADVRASRREQDNWVPPPASFRFDYTFPHADEHGQPLYRGVQNIVQQHWDEPALILRAPTGSGKTDAALLWAKRQVEAGRADRCVIAMPTRFTSNALALNVEDSISDTGLYHSSAWYARYQESVDLAQTDKERWAARDRAQEQHRMARLLMTPLTVCTVDHLCMALTGTREDHHSIFFNLAHACVIFDEADFYDPFVQANLGVLLRTLRFFDVPVLIMSATVPEAACSLYQIPTLAEDRTDLDRVRCRIHDAGPSEEPDDIEATLARVLEADVPQAIVYANTVRRALLYYDWFVDHGITPLLYHSRFTEPDKKERETELIEALGRKAWQEDHAQGVAVLTQIGEMSLNISAPLMISDLCPYDRLAQRAGRLSRFAGMNVGDLYVTEPQKDGVLYPAPYGSYDRKDRVWTPGEALLRTKECLSYEPHTARDFVAAADTLYPDVEAFSPRTPRIDLNRRRLETHIETDWMIVPAHTVQEGEDETQEWQSRDIPAQRVVLTQHPASFRTYAEYQRFELECGVSCPAWQIETGQRLGRIAEVSFEVDDETVRGLYSPSYVRSVGLILDQDREPSISDRFC